MAKCPFHAQGQCDQGGVMTKHGLKIHMGKIHGLHYGDDMVAVALSESECRPLPSEPHLAVKKLAAEIGVNATMIRDHLPTPEPAPSIELETGSAPRSVDKVLNLLEASLMSPGVAHEHREVDDPVVPCGHPFCKVRLPRTELRGHWDAEHDAWLMSNGRYVWEV